MKIAVCYFGNTGGKKGSFGKGGYLDPSYCLNENINNLRNKKYNFDYFIHCWNKEFKKNILKILKPKKNKFEKYNKIKFKNYPEYNLKNFEIYRQYLPEQYENFYDKHLFASQCRIYSQSSSLKMMLQYCNIKKKKYDWILISRIDQIFLNSIKFEKLNKKFTYITYNTKKRFGYEDYFALSPFSHTKKISQWFKYRNKYALTGPDSMKQHFDKFKIKTKPLLKVGKDFILYRNIINSKKFKFYNYLHYLKTLIKNITNIKISL